MSSEKKPAFNAFRGFLGGVAFGVVFGLLANQAWGQVGPYGPQIWAGFWGLVGGVLAVVMGVVYVLLKRR